MARESEEMLECLARQARQREEGALEFESCLGLFLLRLLQMDLALHAQVMIAVMFTYYVTLEQKTRYWRRLQSQGIELGFAS